MEPVARSQAQHRAVVREHIAQQVLDTPEAAIADQLIEQSGAETPALLVGTHQTQRGANRLARLRLVMAPLSPYGRPP